VRATASGLSFTANGKQLAVWNKKGGVTVWETATGKKLRQFQGPAPPYTSPPGADGELPYTAALSPDGTLLAFGFQNTSFPRQEFRLPVLETTTGREVCHFAGIKDWPQPLVFAADGKSLAWGGWEEGSLSVGEIATGRTRFHAAGHRGRITALAFAADGNLLVSGSEDTTAFVWDLGGRLITEAQAGSKPDLAAAWAALAEQDAAAGQRAIQSFLRDPARGTAFLRTRLKPVARPEQAGLKQLIADLDSKQFENRQKAMAELEALGESVLEAMRSARAQKPSLETGRRLDQLIEKAERESWSPNSESLRIRRAVEILERGGQPDAKPILESLADGAPGSSRTRDARAALDRLTSRNN
jgi:hypothetical protein